MIDSSASDQSAGDDPYRTPKAALEIADDEALPLELASRTARLAAALIDTFIYIIFFAVGVYARGGWAYFAQDETSADTVFWFVFDVAQYLLVHGYLLMRYGQTWGKRLLNIRIADLDGRLPHFGKLIGIRFAPFYATGMLPGWLPFLAMAEVLLIFGRERRCLHDYVARTCVVKGSTPPSVS